MRHFRQISGLGERLPFHIKLVGMLMAVILVGVLVVYLLAERSVETSFKELRLGLGTVHAQSNQRVFAEYYEQRGDWRGVAALLDDPEVTMGGYHELVLADPSGRVIAAPDPGLFGRNLSADELEHGAPIEVEGETVAVLVAGTAVDLFSAPEQTFLASVTRSILGAGLAAGLVAALLGIIFVRQLTRPLARLVTATQRVASGELRQSVAIASSDELGRLASSFNRMSERLARSEELRQQMIADIAHELRNPLTVIKSGLQALLDGIYPLTKEQIASVQEETLLLERLLEDLRTLSLADAGELALKRRPVDLVQLIRRTSANSRHMLNEKGVELELKLPDAPVELWIDPERLGQVLFNLLRNAGQYTPEGGRVRLRLERQMDGVLVEVSDTGPGIAAEEVENIFERFWRADKARPRDSGSTGLGLAIARQLVEAHGGRIWVERSSPHGTTFRFALPLSPEPASQTPA